MKRGLFIVLEGTDGSGKTTQFKLLVTALKRAGYSVKTADFPQYSKPSGYFVKQYLNGKYGQSRDISPQLGSMFYAVDRFQTSVKINQWLKQGRIVVANRYVLSSAAHQGGKIISTTKRREFWRWLFNLEHKIFGIPVPDKYILLHTPTKQSQKLVLRKALRRYLHLSHRKRDIHEKDIKHLKAAEKVYLELAKTYHIPVIECVNKGRLLTPLEIHNQVWKVIGKLVK
ncbi:MAG: thymidylate kinase [Patescibacteria group bacterium]